MTPADLIERHVEAVLARIRADAQLSDDVFEGDVTGDPERYVNVWHDTGFFEPRSILGEHQDVDITFTIHSVGDNRWQATWVDGRVLAALNDVVLEVPGRRCWKLQPAGSQPVQKDDDVQPVKFFAVRRFVLHSTPKETP
ncbi:MULTISPECIES: hypothetical protein [unclassified Microbacterium]|uniref:hypothetical protein n=1 Tax=unclassified Microbacterium TaxID=2609290 RepID=UPI000EAAAC54|nr:MULTISPECIES: hypothetical protein [unclassified Microbacterium]MBT2485811.1 hypothetical protein [Microbacterium sp. ISL-108]RKN68574.1 hypothetical protein D7252_13935 [Microbacterium sp. CGR2]